MQICAITVNYNGYADTIECLNSLREQTGVSCHPLVIDNASANDSVAQIRAAHPDVEMLVTTRNLGFCGGNNVGIRHALESDYDYLFLVNNDTAMEPDCLRNLVCAAQARPEAAVVAPAMYYYADRARPWFTGSRMNTDQGELAHALDDVRAQGQHESIELPWCTGCAMLIPAARMRELGGFDERFFCYFEDADWSLRARNQGYVCLLSPTATLYHKVETTSRKQPYPFYYYNTRNRLLFFSKNLAGSERRRALQASLRAIRRDIKEVFTSQAVRYGKRKACAHALGVADFYARRFGPCRYGWLNLRRA